MCGVVPYVVVEFVGKDVLMGEAQPRLGHLAALQQSWGGVGDVVNRHFDVRPELCGDPLHHVGVGDTSQACRATQ